MGLDFTYQTGENIIPENVFKISPSRFSKFFTEPGQWYREEVLGEKDIIGTTSTHLGKIIHACIKAYLEGDNGKTWENDVNNYIENLDPEIDKEEIKKQWKNMVLAIINQYVKNNKPDSSEEYIWAEIIEGYVAAGTADARKGDTVIDFKTYNSKYKPKTIPIYYRYQLLVYAWIYTQMDIQINRIKLVYVNREIDDTYISEKTGKYCGKIIQPTVTVISEEISKNDLNSIECALKLCAETVKKAKENPDLIYLLFKDYNLKEVVDV